MEKDLGFISYIFLYNKIRWWWWSW